jgi:hypothetical protein
MAFLYYTGTRSKEIAIEDDAISSTILSDSFNICATNAILRIITVAFVAHKIAIDACYITLVQKGVWWANAHGLIMVENKWGLATASSR